MNDERPARRATHVELDPIGPKSEREPKGLRRVLQRRPRGPAMSQYKRASHAPQPTAAIGPNGGISGEHHAWGLARTVAGLTPAVRT